MGAWCLRPQDTYSAIDGRNPLPLGTVLIVQNGDRDLQSVGEAFQQWRINPWCPGVLLTSRPFARPLLDVIKPVAMHLTIIETPDLPPVPTLRSIVRGRPAPDTADLAAYLAVQVSIRCAGLFLSSLKSDIDTAYLRRPLRKLGRWSPRDWRAVAHCVKVIAGAISRRQTEAAAAEQAGVDLKTVSAWCHRYFGTAWRSIVGLQAWEAVFELALRHGEYVNSR